MNTAVSVASIASAAAIPSPTLAAVAQPNEEAAALARFEQMLEVLRTSHVAPGWEVDEAAADRALRYMRGRAADKIDDGDDKADDAAREAMVDFVLSHGQSFDWIVDGDPRVLIARCASASPRADELAAAANGLDDPIFKAMAQHHEAVKVLRAVCHAESDEEDRWRARNGDLRPSLFICTREEWETKSGSANPWPFGEADELRIHHGRQIERLLSELPDVRQRWRAELASIKREYRSVFGPIKSRFAAAFEAEAEARRQLAATAPTTGLGVRSVLNYIEGQEKRSAGDFFDNEERGDFYASLCRSTWALESSQVPSAA